MKKKQKALKPPTALNRTTLLRANTSSTDKHWKSIRIDRPYSLPSYVREAIQRLNEAGYVAYVVGGSVRDYLLNRESKDHDIATSATPDRICELFPRAITVGKAFGVIKVPTNTEPPLLEIATFREDLEYQDHRHPTGVVFSGPFQDAQRRDFTINGLFFDPKTGRILDSVGGVEDLHAKVIRAIGDPSERFKEDALRLLRAVRFATRFGFQLEPNTAAAIHARAKLISKVSAERIRDELNGMWIGPRPAQALQMLADLRLLDMILPEVESLKGVPQIPAIRPQEDAWGHVLRVLDHLTAQSPKRSSVVSWAAVLHEVGKPIASQLSGGKNFNGHELEGAKIVERVTTRLKMSRAETNQIVALVSDHLKFKDVFQMRESTLERWIRQPYFEDLLALHRADAAASDGNLAYYEFCAHRLDAFKKAPSVEIQKLIDGKDLIQMGFSPGPEFSEILRVVEDLALEKKLSTKEEALEYVVKNFVK